MDYERTVNLMILEDGEKKHYVAIKSLGRLLTKMNSKYKVSQHFCNNCLQGFSDITSRDNHYEYWRSNESIRIEMPTRNPILVTQMVNTSSRFHSLCMLTLNQY